MCLFESHEALMVEIKKLEHVLKVTVRKELAILMFAALELLEKKMRFNTIHCKGAPLAFVVGADF